MNKKKKLQIDYKSDNYLNKTQMRDIFEENAEAACFEKRSLLNGLKRDLNYYEVLFTLKRRKSIHT